MYKIRKIVENKEPDNRSPYNNNLNFDRMMRFPNKFAGINKLILRDLNKSNTSPTFYLYDKDQISSFLKNPYTNEKNIRNAVIYMYGASSHFRRLIQYFVSLSDLSYVVSPYKIDSTTAKEQTIRRNYIKTLNILSAMDIKNQFSKVLTVCLREDVFYATLHVGSDSVIIQQLPSDYCKISTIEDNVPNVSFDFSYFDSNQNLGLYPAEFEQKYRLYQNDRTNFRWQELDSTTSFAIKCNNDILNYAIPPFIGILRDIYDLEDYRQLKLTKTELENYAMLVMKLGINSNGEWDMDFNKAKEFWMNLDSVLPEEIGSVLSPMDIQKISFEKSNTKDTDTITDAEQHLFSAAGVSSLLFNNEKASANALLLSIKADQSLTYGIVKSIESAINRFLHRQSYGKNFKVTFLDCSPFNRKEMGDAYIKACSYGVPMISYYCASQGLSQADIENMNFLENDVLGLASKFTPLQISSTMSKSSSQTATESANGDAGRPEKEVGDLTDAGEVSKEQT